MGYMRRELMPPVLDDATVARLARLADQVVDLIEGKGEFRPAMMRFNVEAGTDWTAADFVEGVASVGTREFAKRALTRRPGRVADVTYEELLEVVRRVMEGEGSESEIQFWIDLLQANLPVRSVSNLIYWPWGCPEPAGARKATAREVLDAALAGRGVVGEGGG